MLQRFLRGVLDVGDRLLDAAVQQGGVGAARPRADLAQGAGGDKAHPGVRVGQRLGQRGHRLDHAAGQATQRFEGVPAVVGIRALQRVQDFLDRAVLVGRRFHSLFPGFGRAVITRLIGRVVLAQGEDAGQHQGLQTNDGGGEGKGAALLAAQQQHKQADESEQQAEATEGDAEDSEAWQPADAERQQAKGDGEAAPRADVGGRAGRAQIGAGAGACRRGPGGTGAKPAGSGISTGALVFSTPLPSDDGWPGGNSPLPSGERGWG